MYLIQGDFLATSSADTSFQHTDTTVICNKHQQCRQFVCHRAGAITSKNTNGTDLTPIILYIACDYCYKVRSTQVCSPSCTLSIWLDAVCNEGTT